MTDRHETAETMATTTPTRRRFLQGTAAAGLLATPAAALLSACGAAGTGTAGQGKTSSKNPFGVDASAPLEVVIFKGGYGDDYARSDTDIYKKGFPNASIKFADVQQVTQEYQPRFVAGNPPDIMDDSGAYNIQPGTLVGQHQLADLEDFWNAPSHDDASKKVKDTVLFDTQKDAVYNGKHYVLLYALSLYGLWYSQPLFQEKGWKYPQTWSDMLNLCAEIKQSGMAPWTYQGKYPSYMVILWSQMAQKIGGPDVMKKIDNLEPNAWKQDAVMEALDALYQLATKDYIMQGTPGLTHIESQTAWLQKKAAFIPCGSWLENEMKQFIPQGFDMVIAPPPSVTKKDKMGWESINSYAGEDFIVPSKGKNVAGGKEFMRIMCSKQAAQQFTKLTRTLTIVKGAADGLDISKTDTALKSSLEWLNKGAPRVPSALFGTWYAELNNTVKDAMGSMMTRRSTPQDFVQTVQSKADSVKSDPNITKFKRA